MNELMTTTTAPVFQNEKLNNYTQKILNIGTDMKKQVFKLAVILSDVDKADCLKEDGFKNVADYALQTFNIRKSLTYNLIKIGAEYLDRKALTTTLEHDGEKDFNATQLGEVVRLGYNKVSDLAKERIITPEMTVRQIREVVKEEKALNEMEENGGEPVEVIETPKTYKILIWGEWHEERREVEWTHEQIESFRETFPTSKVFKNSNAKKRIYLENDEGITILLYL